jgi:hypothetical protein
MRSRGTGGGWRLTLEVQRELAVSADVRPMLDDLLGKLYTRLRGRPTPALANEWHLVPVAGATTGARAEILLTSRNGAAYLGRVAPSAIAAIVPQVLAEWLPRTVAR